MGAGVKLSDCSDPWLRPIHDRLGVRASHLCLTDGKELPSIQCYAQRAFSTRALGNPCLTTTLYVGCIRIIYRWGNSSFKMNGLAWGHTSRNSPGVKNKTWICQGHRLCVCCKYQPHGLPAENAWTLLMRIYFFWKLIWDKRKKPNRDFKTLRQ